MEVVGPGSSRLAWHGRVELGDDWACYLGPVTQQSFHAHVAAQIAVGLNAVTVQSAGLQDICGRAVLIPAFRANRRVSYERLDPARCVDGALRHMWLLRVRKLKFGNGTIMLVTRLSRLRRLAATDRLG